MKIQFTSFRFTAILLSLLMLPLVSFSQEEGGQEVASKGSVLITGANRGLGLEQALMPNLEAGKMKKIINMSTRSSIISRPRRGAWGYRVSKAGLNMVTSTLHGELHKKGYIVCSVAPGHNKTDMGTDRGKQLPEVTMPKLKKVIENLNKKKSGGFWYYDGSRLPW